ncbi:MAG TPA: hypothetical protein VF062_15445 [Candidatus Limnocylindrales bacterium]
MSPVTLAEQAAAYLAGYRTGSSPRPDPNPFDLPASQLGAWWLGWYDRDLVDSAWLESVLDGEV